MRVNKNKGDLVKLALLLVEILENLIDIETEVSHYVLQLLHNSGPHFIDFEELRFGEVLSLSYNDWVLEDLLPAYSVVLISD